MDNTLQLIADRLRDDLTSQLSPCGLMFRLFVRVKTVSSIRHKMEFKGHQYLDGKHKIQDVLGVRIVTYFQDDVDVLSFYFTYRELVKSSIDEPDITTFCPRRLNITRKLPEDTIAAFRNALPPEFAPYIDDTYEIQIRTVFSEGWHEVEHDLRYKCKNDWVGCEDYSRLLNGLIASLETSEWNMKALFNDMAYRNMRQGNFRAMLRNKMRLRILNEDFSPQVNSLLLAHPEVAEKVYDVDRMIVLLTILNHNFTLPMTYDNLLFLMNRIEMNEPLLQALEPADVKAALDQLKI